jgi:hypothetical protein
VNFPGYIEKRYIRFYVVKAKFPLGELDARVYRLVMPCCGTSTGYHYLCLRAVSRRPPISTPIWAILSVQSFFAAQNWRAPTYKHATSLKQHGINIAHGTFSQALCRMRESRNGESQKRRRITQIWWTLRVGRGSKRKLVHYVYKRHIHGWRRFKAQRGGKCEWAPSL